MKKNNAHFDVPMGSFDSAEVCELVALYLLHLLKQENLGIECGAYRDDLLATSNLRPRETENVKKKICQIFREQGLKITIECKKKICDFLDVTLNLNDGSYQPCVKPNNIPVYVNAKSNHPKSSIKRKIRKIGKKDSFTSTPLLR